MFYIILQFKFVSYIEIKFKIQGHVGICKSYFTKSEF